MSGQVEAVSGWGVTRRTVQRNGGVFVAVVTLAVVFIVLDLNLAHGFGYFDLSSTSASTAALALAAIGETIIVISGGLDLSSGAMISLSNCLVVTNMGTSTVSMILWSLLGVLAGALVGAINGFLIVRFKLQPIIVTLATMFIIEGATLLELGQPGGSVPVAFTSFFSGDSIPGILPTPILILALALLCWGIVKHTPFGTFIYAIGSDEDAAATKGVPVQLTKFWTYVLGGSFYGAAGVFMTAQTGSGDPTVGPPMLLSIFVAVVLGGTVFTGGRGGCVGTVVGAVTLMLISNLLLVLNVPTFYSSIAEGALLIMAVLGNSFGRASALQHNLRILRLKLVAINKNRNLLIAGAQTDYFYNPEHILRTDESLPEKYFSRSLVRNASMLRLTLPAYIALLAALFATAIMFGSRISVGSYLDSLLVLGSFLAVLALGQGVVVISGGLDLSLPAVITFSGVLLTGLTGGSNDPAIWGIPLVLAIGTCVGALNGVGVALFRIPPLIMTLAMNGIIQGASLIYSGGTPAGSSPGALSWMMNGRILGVTPVVVLLLIFVLLATLLLEKTTFGRKLYAVGNSPIAAKFSGVSVGWILAQTYALSGLCAAIVGIMLVGFSGQAFNDMGDPYLLSSIAVVVIGGALMTGGQGHYLGMFGAALLLTVLTTILTGLLIPESVRSIIFGVVILTAIIGLQNRTR